MRISIRNADFVMSFEVFLNWGCFDEGILVLRDDDLQILGGPTAATGFMGASTKPTMIRIKVFDDLLSFRIFNK
jgi:hypothetical protein